MPKQSLRKDTNSGPSFHPYRKSRIQDGVRKVTESPNRTLEIEQMARILATKKKIVIISGAGISTNAGSTSQKLTLCDVNPN